MQSKIWFIFCIFLLVPGAGWSQDLNADLNTELSWEFKSRWVEKPKKSKIMKKKIFQKMYIQKEAPKPKKNSEKIVDYVKGFKSLLDYEVRDGVSVRVNRFTTGPLSPKETQILPLAHAVSPRDNSKVSGGKGFGLAVKFKF